MIKVVQRLLQALPLVGIFLLLPLVTTVADIPLTRSWPLPLRLDSLTLVFAVSLCAAAGLPAVQGALQSDHSWRNVLQSLAALVVLLPALVVEHLIALPLALLLTAIILRSWRWGAAVLVLLAGLLLLRATGARSWYAIDSARGFSPPIFLLILTATCVGLDCYPASLANERSNVLRLRLQPVWLLPLLRTYTWGPWSSGWALAAVLIGGATTLWSAYAALWTGNDTKRSEHIAGTWLGMALTTAGLATPVGTASALWQVGVYGLGLVLLQPDAHERSRGALWAAPFPPAAAFSACWLAQGAAAASGAFILAAIFWLATLACGLAVLRLLEGTSSRWSASDLLLTACSIALGLFSPIVLRWLIVPAVELLQGGLTPFGLLDIWPWVGVAALDAGQRRVAVLPSIAVALLALVMAALAWLLARLLGWMRPSEAVEPQKVMPWDELRKQVWWARGFRRRG